MLKKLNDHMDEILTPYSIGFNIALWQFYVVEDMKKNTLPKMFQTNSNIGIHFLTFFSLIIYL